MESLDLLIEGIVSLFLIAIFVGLILPTLAEVSGQSMTIFIILFIFIGIGIVIAIIAAFMRETL